MICKSCSQEKMPGEFYPGVLSKCKECHKSAMRKRARTNPKVQEYDRARAKTDKRRKHNREVSKKWRQDHPIAYRAQNMVNNGLRDGKLKKGPCSICGATNHLHAHHRDYSKPLEVTWLCAKCHHRLHAAFPELGGHYEVRT
jgi:hypothetical protein